MAQPSIDFYYDVSCPFAYIASTRIEGLASRTHVHVNWRPVLLGAIYRATSAPQGAAGSASDVFNPTKKAVSGKAFQRTLKRFNVAYNEPPRHPVKTTAALRVLYFVSETDRPQLTHALFRAYWVDGKNVSDIQTLITAVRQSSISNADEVIQALQAGTFEGAEQRNALEKSTDLAVQRGSPGVPAFWLPHEIWTDQKGQDRKGRLYWGQDRMQFIEAVLLAGGDRTKVSQISQSLRSLEARLVKQSIPSGDEVKVEFWYDFSSPWAFLGWTQLDRLQRQFGSALKIDPKPFLLGILFREIGAPNLPMAAISEQKRSYSSLDHHDWVRWWNAVNEQEGRPDKNIDFKWASKFPIRTPTVLRAVLVEPALVGPLFRGCWERDLDMADDQVLRQVIDEAGMSGEDVLRRANSQECKADLRARTGEAQKIGLCGVPSYRVFRRRAGAGEQGWKLASDIVWGQDLMTDVEDYVAGWDVGGSETREQHSKL